MGRAAVWVARNRVAKLDDITNYIVIKNMQNKVIKVIEMTPSVNKIYYAGTGFLLLRTNDSVTLYDVQQEL